MDSGIVTVPRELKTRPGAPQTHLAYITGDEAQMLQEHKPGTPHEGAAGIPNYDSSDIGFGGWETYTSSGSPGGGNGGGNDNNSGWGNDPQGEFGGSPTVIQESEDDYYEDDGYWDPPVGTDPPINYVPGQTSDEEDFISAYGGLSYDWVDPDSAFFTEDIWGNPLPDHGDDWYTGGGLWNPFIAGFNPETGEPIVLTEGQFNDMMTFGEFGSPYNTGVQTGGNGGGGGRRHGWGGWGSSNLNYGNRSGYGKYANWANRPFMEQSFDSPMPQYYASLKNPGQPINQRLFMDMVAGMNKGGIMGVRK